MADKCIRVDCTQSSANYKKPMSVEVAETFFLPPYSTVIGFVHVSCGFDSYRPMQISVQGSYDTMISDLYTRYFMGQTYEEGRHYYRIENKENPKGDGVVRGLGHNELLVGVKLVLHIKPEKEEDFDVILKGLQSPAVYPSIGRYEDLLRIDNVSVVEYEPTDSVNLKYNAYIPEKLLSSIDGRPNCTMYVLNKVYTKDKDRRDWQKERAYYFPKGENVHLDNLDFFVEKKSGTGIFFA